MDIVINCNDVVVVVVVVGGGEGLTLDFPRTQWLINIAFNLAGRPLMTGDDGPRRADCSLD